MALVNKPDENIFASSAKQGEVDNFPDLLRGWGMTFEQTQGIPPMEWFNFLFKRLDEKHAYLMQRGLPEWSATQDYTEGSCVQFNGLSYRALKAGKNNQPDEANSQYWVRWGFALTEIAKATLTQYGLTELYTGYDSQREDLALTPKTAFMLKALFDSLARNQQNYITNSKKSSRVDSNSADDVATSAAVKSAYDKALESLNFTANLKDFFIGVPIPYPLAAVPSGCLAMNGQRFDIARYPKLAQKYPSGVLPDLRGEFIRGWDNGRELLSAQKDALQNHFHYLPTNGGTSTNPEENITAVIRDNYGIYSRTEIGAWSEFNGENNERLNNNAVVKTYSLKQGGQTVRFDSETRPRNIAYHYICLAE